MFRKVWVARVASGIGDAIVPVALTFAVLDASGVGGLGVVLAAMTASRGVSTLAGGVWADRLPRRSIMVAADLLRAAVQAALAAAVLAGADQLWMFIGGSLVFGAASGFFEPASTALLTQIVHEENLQRANALLSLAQSVTKVAGPALGGAFVVVAGTGWVFAVDAATFILSAIALFGVAAPAPRLEHEEEPFFRDLATGLRAIKDRAWLWKSFVGAAVSNLGVGPFLVLGPVVVSEAYGGPETWGVILSASAAGVVLGGALAYRISPSRPLVASIAISLLIGLPNLALGVSLPVALVIASSVAYGIGVTTGNVLLDTVLQRELPPHLLGRVISLDWMISFTLMPIGQALAGPLSNIVGDETTLALAFLIMAGQAIALLASADIRSPKLGLPLKPAATEA